MLIIASLDHYKESFIEIAYQTILCAYQTILASMWEFFFVLVVCLVCLFICLFLVNTI